MRILVVTHRFPPRHQTGAELYGLRLARELASRHDIVVLTADDDVMRRNGSRSVRNYEGLHVVEVQNHRTYESFADTYSHRPMERHFVEVLESFNPDIVHFQHLLHHSVELPNLARERGIPSVLTLHEYWFLCGRNGQMIQADGDRCELPALDKCARCLLTFHWGRRNLDLWMLRGLDSVKRLTGVDLKGQARRLRLRRFESLDPGQLDPADVDRMKRDLLLREARVRDMFDAVDCMIAPSEFLRQRFVAFGVEPSRILLNDYGTKLDAFRSLPPRPQGDQLRVGYIGSIQPVKGVHLLAQAMEELDERRFVVKIFGDLGSKPEYSAILRKRAIPGLMLLGRVSEESIPLVLADLDVLVVPSIWWENSPLVIHEAFAAGVPVVCSDIGGMAERVRDGIDGLHFHAADADSLAAALRRLVDEPGLLQRLKQGIQEPKPIAIDAQFHEQVFEVIISNCQADAAAAVEDEFEFEDEI